MSLKDVIRKLSEGPSNQYIPYRDNKLTLLMRDSIGGNAKTLMFVNISPADYNSQETKLSLFFGESAKKIKNDVRKNVESQEVAKLKDELLQLKRQLGISGVVTHQVSTQGMNISNTFTSSSQVYGGVNNSSVMMSN